MLRVNLKNLNQIEFFQGIKKMLLRQKYYQVKDSGWKKGRYLEQSINSLFLTVRNRTHMLKCQGARQKSCIYLLLSAGQMNQVLF